MTQVDVRPRRLETDASKPSAADAEATAISRATAVMAGALVAVAGLCAFLEMLQASGLALFAALVASIASVAGRPSRGARWVGPVVVGTAMLAVIVAGFIQR